MRTGKSTALQERPGRKWVEMGVPHRVLASSAVTYLLVACVCFLLDRHKDVDDKKKMGLRTGVMQRDSPGFMRISTVSTQHKGW